MIPAGFDADRVADLLRQVAADVVLPGFHGLEAGDISEKREGDLVTVVDLASEAWLTDRLQALLPGSTVVGEEAVFADPAVLERLAEAEPAWIIDPIDGTWNFAHGKPTFAVIVALAVSGEVVGGWIHEPVSGRLAMGVRGGGVTLDGRGVRLSDRGDGRIEGTAARHLRERAEAETDVIDQVYRTNCAGHEYMTILAGDRQFSAYTRVLPWDHAAGSFLIREAGGYSALLDSQGYDIVRPEGELLNATSEGLWRRLQNLLKDRTDEN